MRDILQGWVGFFNNYNLCHTRSIVWREILSGANDSFNYVYNFTADERTCPKCDASCERDACWGEGPQNCQKFSKITCAPQCAQGRCFGPGPRDCCHLFCAGGCTGPTQRIALRAGISLTKASARRSVRPCVNTIPQAMNWR